MKRLGMRLTKVKRFAATLCLLLMTLGSLSCADTELKLAHGEGLARSSLESKFLVINHWATWCAPCRVEIPELNLLAASLDPNEAVVLGYGEDFHTGQELLEDIRDMGIEFPVLSEDPSKVWGYGGSNVLPRTAIIAPGGDVLEILLGPQTRESVLAVLDNK